jgi:hypothetical protein
MRNITRLWREPAGFAPQERASVVRAVFGGTVAIVLLAFYVYAVWYACAAAACLGGAVACTAYVPQLTPGANIVFTVVGGLLSALVVAELAVSDPGTIPTGTLVVGLPGAQERALRAITIVYLSVWVICGIAIVVIGLMRYPDAVPALTEGAKEWLGIAVGAAYAYFGLKPPSGQRGAGLLGLPSEWRNPSA